MDVRGFSNFARQQLADVQVAKYLQALLRLFDEYVASRLQDFSRPTGVTVGCVPDFMPPLRSAIQTVGPDLFLLKELDASSLKGVLGESTLTVYTYAPAVASAHVIADLEERKTVRVVQHAQLSEMLTSGNEIQQRGAIGVICANRLQSFVEDLKRLATDAGLPMTLRDSALAAYYILVGPAGIPLIQRILQDAAKSKEWDLVIASLLASSRFKTSGVTASIIALLKENVPMKVEVHAMNTLKLLGSPDAKEVLCSRLESPNWGIQQQAAEALAEIPFDGKVELLGEALLDQKTHARLRATLAELLGDITTDESLNCLLKAFPLVDGMAQTVVVVALSKLKDPRASSELAKLAESSSAPLDNRLAAIDALATVGAPDSIVTLTSLAESPTESHLIRGHCIVGLKELRAIASLPCLLKIAENEEEHVPLRVAALDAMSGLDAPELIAVARKLMGHDDPRLRLSAVYALGKMGDHTSFHEISKWALAEGESESTRIACLRALLDMDETIAGELIVSHFETLPIDCKCDIVKYMGEKKLSSAVDFFINLANSPDTAGDTRLQIRSIAALSKLRDHHVVQARLRILRDPQKNEHVRAASAEALGEQKPLVVPQWLGGGMLDENHRDRVKRAVAAALLRTYPNNPEQRNAMTAQTK